MNLAFFDVDLRGYSGPEYVSRYERLDGLAWTLSEYAKTPGVFHASIDLEVMDGPLPTLLNVPTVCVIQTG